MKKKHFSEEQIVRMLRHAEITNQAVAQICKTHGICENIWYRWKQKRSGASRPITTPA